MFSETLVSLFGGRYFKLNVIFLRLFFGVNIWDKHKHSIAWNVWAQFYKIMCYVKNKEICSFATIYSFMKGIISMKPKVWIFVESNDSQQVPERNIALKLNFEGKEILKLFEVFFLHTPYIYIGNWYLYPLLLFLLVTTIRQFSWTNFPSEHSRSTSLHALSSN